MLRTAPRIGDLPGTPQQLHRLASAVLDLHAVGSYVMAVIRFRLVLEEEGPDGDADPAGGLGVILGHGKTGLLVVERRIQSERTVLVQHHGPSAASNLGP